MGAVGNTNPTLIDVATRLVNGKVEKEIVEMLSETNEVIDDATWLECNDGTSHKTTVRSGIPQGTWRQLNYGVQPSKSTTVQVKDACGMLENYAQVDKALVDMAGEGGAAFRMSEEGAFIEGMNQSFVDTLFYGNTATNPERFMGLAPRFNSLSGAENSQNIITGGGSSALTSIWLVVWSPRTVHCIYPKGSSAGLSQKDLGEQTITLADGSMYQAMRTHYKWTPGLSVRDWRYVVRIPNIDTTALTKNAGSGADLCDLMVQALEKVPSLQGGRAAFYGNRTISSYLRRQMLNKSNVQLAMGEVAGKKVMTFGEVPFRRCDALLNTETAVA